VRAEEQRRGRECLYPEVSRDRHIGELGANMDAQTFKRYDKHVVLNDALHAALPAPAALEKAAYEQELARILANGRVVRDLHELLALSGVRQAAAASCGSCSQGALVVYYAAGMSVEPARDASGGEMVYADGRANSHTGSFKPISNFFGLWHEARRGQHEGMHRFHYGGQCVLLVDAGSEYASKHMPPGLVALQGQNFGRVLWERMYTQAHA
jgi:hypothetical protein